MDADKMLLADALEVAIESSEQLIKYKRIARILLASNFIMLLVMVAMIIGG